jgi:hypothetical protein
VYAALSYWCMRPSATRVCPQYVLCESRWPQYVMCPHRIPLYVCPHASMFVSSYLYMCVLMPCVSSCLYICVLITLFVASYLYVCVLIPLYVCPHTTYLSSYLYICVLIFLYMCPRTYVCVCPRRVTYVLDIGLRK